MNLLLREEFELLGWLRDNIAKTSDEEYNQILDMSIEIGKKIDDENGERFV